MASTRMRPTIGDLQLAFGDRFDDRHALMAKLHLGHIDQFTANIDAIDQEVSRVLAPVTVQRDQLKTIPGSVTAPRRSSSPRSASTCPGSRPPRTWRPGSGCALATTRPPASAVRSTLPASVSHWS